MVVVSLASFFAGTLFSLQAAIGNQVNAGPSASEIESLVAARVKEGTFILFVAFVEYFVLLFLSHFRDLTN
jgi:hypothetical protein